MNELLPKPIAEYLVDGPIPPDELMYIDFLDEYVESLVDTRLDIHFMLEHVGVHGAPKWWKGTVAEFEAEFHQRYHHPISIDKKWEEEAIWRAAYAEVKAGRLTEILEGAEDEQVNEFLAQGQRRINQLWAVELLMLMWGEARENDLLEVESSSVNVQKGENRVKEVIIINLLDLAIAQMTAKILSRKYSGISFKVTKYYSEHHHVVAFQDIPQEQLPEIKGYAMGISDMLSKLTEI